MAITRTLNGNIYTWTSGTPGVPALTFDTSKAKVAAQAALYGYGVRVDRANANGKTDAEKMELMRAVVEHYTSGSTDWALAARGGRGGGSGYTLQAYANTDFKGDLGKAEVMVANMVAKSGKTRAEVLAEVAKVKRIVAEIGRLRADAAPEDVGNDVLAEMMAAGGKAGGK